MRVCELTPRQLRQRLAGPGLRLRTGPLVSCIRSTLTEVIDGVALHYAEHPVDDEQGFADFHFSIERPRSLRRWVEPQVLFRFDGDAPFSPLPGDQGFPMMEWGLNWCITGLCHQFLTLHAAVVEQGGRALILPAPSGSGKSTLCAGLIFRGWRLLSDELTMIEPATGLVVPLPRPVSLKNASIDVMRAFEPTVRFGRIVHETTKGKVGHFVPSVDHVRRVEEKARPAWVVLPKYEPGAPATLTPMPKGQMLMSLIENAFNYNVHGAGGFDLLVDLVDRCDCYRFTYSRLDEAATLFARLGASGTDLAA